MGKKIRRSDLPEFDAAEYLDSEESITEYLTAMMEDGDPSPLAAALGDIARARGMSVQLLRNFQCQRPHITPPETRAKSILPGPFETGRIQRPSCCPDRA